MNQHPDFTNLSNIGGEVLRHERNAVARRSVLARGDLFRLLLSASSDRHASDAKGGVRHRSANSGLLLAELDRYFAALPRLNA